MKKIVGFIGSLLAVAIIFTGCDKEKVVSPSGTYIEGYIEGIQGGELILVQSLMSNSIETVDTIIPDADGGFTVGPNIPKIGFYRIFINNNNFVNLILEPNDTLLFSANVEDLEGSYVIEGNEEAQKLKELNDMLNAYVDKIDSLNNLVGIAKSQQYYNEVAFLMSAQEELQMNTGKKMRAFVVGNSTYLASLSAVQKLDPDGDFELFVKVKDDLEPKIGGTELHKGLSDQIAVWKKAQIGSEMLDITLNNPEGEPIKLFEQLGEITLVDFWASWCRPCRGENPNIVKAYEKYKSKGFTVVGVSLDEDAELWKRAIKQDNLTWTHMSDLKLWNSAVVAQYNISSVPASFLVDKNGKILAKNLRGAALDLKLMQLLGE
ncbi:TlpA family protein disulfide reductase [Salibacteraceae bacterium]|jgi:peroxiredoxin|nr:TlpA family protein disulfide reductase [Salibacteraceae bacterium]MDC1203981.1 TlpA family protein disulfide reductase [Salibacteraceae bacterium]